MLRSPVKSFLVLAVALIFIIAISWMGRAIEHSKEVINELYENTVVEAEIVQKSPSASIATSAGAVIGKALVDSVMDSGFIQNSYTEIGTYCTFLVPVIENPTAGNTESRIDAISLLGIKSIGEFQSEGGADISIEYAKNFSEKRFDSNRGDRKESLSFEVILPEDYMLRMGVNLGDEVYFVNEAGQDISSFNALVAGKYTGSVVSNAGAQPVLIPFDVLRFVKKNDFNYVTAKFEFDSLKNRDLRDFKAEMQKLASRPNAGLLELNFIFWDAELIRVVEPVEKNLSLLEVLYPVTFAVSILISAGLSLLLVYQRAKDAAILCVLGGTRLRVCGVICAEKLIPCITGLLFGTLITHFISGLENTAIIFAVSYAVGAFIGASVGAAVIYRQKTARNASGKGIGGQLWQT